MIGHLRPGIALAAAVLLGAACSGPGAAAPPTARSSPPSPAGSSTSPSTGGTAPAPRGSSSPARPRGEFTISFAGDVHFAGRVAVRLDDPATVFGSAHAALTSADLTMVNLETAIATGGEPAPKEFTFRAPPSALSALAASGVDVATMANNHGADYGAEGIRESLRAIRRSGFPVVGIGRDERAAFAPFTTTLNGTRVAIIAADQVQDETTLRLYSAGPHTPGVANAFSPLLLDSVRRAHAAGYVVVVYLHWGIEYRTCPSALQTGLAGQLADAGAAAVVGSHAHVLQGAGWLRDGTYVSYGLGNYLWWMSFGNDQDDNGVLTLTFRGGHVVADHFAPAHLDDRGVPVPARGAERHRIAAEWNADRSCTDLSAVPPK